MKEFTFDFYNSANIKSYNLGESIRYQLSILDSLDAFTRRHCENVANLTCRLCEQLHMKSYFTVYCTTCAYLHDVGKQFIPSSILQKNGPLTEEEYKVMKSHTTIGYKLCMNDPKLRDFANGALYHHEALNGTGYPNGVTSKDIPLEGKIIRVADEFDAIVSKRQYKSHIGICQTLQILAEEAKTTKVTKTSALKVLKEEASGKENKIDPKIFKALVKIVVDDTEYEIYCLTEYIRYLNENVNRLNKIMTYKNKIDNSSKQSDKDYYTEVIRLMFAAGENFNNYVQVFEEYKTACSVRQQELDKLRSELKEIKKFK